jgi:hypothetical protein
MSPVSQRSRNRAAAPTHPLWLRVLALACLLVVGTVSTVQAVHIHGEWLPTGAHRAGLPADASQVPGGEEHCPLCVAMHSALPTALQMAPEPALVAEADVVEQAMPAAETHWHFAMFSRPPPVAVEKV